MPKSAFLVQEDDFGPLTLGTVDHTNGQLEIHRQTRSAFAAGMRSHFVKGDNYILGWDNTENVFVRDLDNEIVYENREMGVYVAGSKPSSTAPFSIDEEWMSYGDIFYITMTRNWSDYFLFVIDLTSGTPVTSEVPIDTSTLPTFDIGSILYNGLAIYAVGEVDPNLFKVLKQIKGQATWTELHSSSCSGNSGFQRWWHRPNKDIEHFFFTAAESSRDLQRLQLNLLTDAVTLTVDFVTNIWPSAAGPFKADTEKYRVDIGQPNRYYMSGSVYEQPFTTYYGVNAPLEAGQGQDGVSSAHHLTRDTPDGSAIYIPNGFQPNQTYLLNFKPDLTEEGVFIGNGSYSDPCIVLMPDGSLQLRENLTNTNIIVLSQTAPGFIQGGVYNRFSLHMKPDYSLVLANDTGSGPQYATLSGSINLSYGARYGSGNYHYSHLVKRMEAYVDGLAAYEPTWSNYPYFGQSLGDETPSIEAWTQFPDLPRISRRFKGKTLGDFLSVVDENSYETFYKNVTNPGFDLAANSVDFSRQFSLVFPNGDTSNEGTGSYGAIFDLPGSNYVLYVTEYSVATVARATGVVVDEWVVETNSGHEIGYDYCQGLFPITNQYAVNGTVKDSSDTPIAGVELQLVSKDGKQILAETVSDVNGQYSFTCFTANKKVVVAKNPADLTANYQIKANLVPVAA